MRPAETTAVSSTAALTSVRAPYPLRGGLPCAPAASDLHFKRGPPVTLGRVVELLAGVAVVGGAVLAMGAHFLAGVLIAFPALLLSLRMVNARLKRLNDKNARLIAQMEAGDVDEAVTGLRALIDDAGKGPHAAVAATNLAAALSRRGDLDAALAVHTAVDRAFAKLRKRPQGQTLAMNSAHFFALLGDTAGAAAWLDEAKRRGCPEDAIAMTWTDVIVALRSKRPADALARIDAGWATFEAKLPATSTRKLRVLRAFALAQLKRDGSEVTAALEGTRPYRAHDYSALATEWPELRAFLVDNRLL